MMMNDWNIPGSSSEIYLNTFVPAAVSEWGPRVLEHAKPELGEKVLDVVCGTDVLTRAAAKAVRQNGSVIRVDLGPETLN